MEPDESIVRQKVRGAMWRGAFKMLGIQILLLIVAGVAFPIFTSSYAYSGPGMGPYRIAEAIERRHQENGSWATSLQELRPYLLRYPRHTTYVISFHRLDRKQTGAEYAISVNGNLQAYRFEPGGGHEKMGEIVRPETLGEKDR